MKYKKMTVKKSGDQLLRVNVGKHDVFDYATAVRLSNNTFEGLLHLTFSGNERRPSIYYKVTGLINLPLFLANLLSLGQFRAFLQSFFSAMRMVGASGLQEKNLDLSVENVYVDSDSNAHLVYLPVTGLVANDRSALDLLIHVANNARFVDAENKQSARDLLDYLRRQQVFSLVEARRFMGFSDTAATGADSRSDPLFDPPKMIQGRDFVGEASGVQAKEQAYAAQSVTQNAVKAISGGLSLGEGIVTSDDARRLQPGGLRRSYAEALIPSNDTAVRESRFGLVRLDDSRTFHLPIGQLTIGRSRDCDLTVSDKRAVSRLHAVVSVTDDFISVEDKESANGTFINGERIDSGIRVLLRLGDELMLGDVQFNLLDASSRVG